MKRIPAARVSQTIGEQVIVENQGGAGGTVGAANVVKRAPDPYNWFFGAVHHTIQIRAGKLIPLAVTAQRRNPVLPNVPNVGEAGVPGYEVRTWYGLWALKGTPQPSKDRMWKEVVAAMDTPQLKSIWAEQGADPGG